MLLLPVACGSGRTVEAERPGELRVTRVDMTLSAFGVEADELPSIEVHIDFEQNRGTARRTYFNPAYKPSTYQLTGTDLHGLRALLRAADLSALHGQYAASATDLPTSTIVVHTTKQQYVIRDYGLVGDYPLRELYAIAYKH